MNDRPFTPSRRYLLQRSACGFGLMGLASLLGQSRIAAEPQNPLAPKAAAFPWPSEARHFPVHARWSIAHGHLRSQAAADSRIMASRCPSSGL